MAEQNENKKEPSKNEFVFLGLILLCLLAGSIVQKTSFAQFAPICWILAGVCVVFWILSVRKEKKKEDNQQ